MSWSQSKNSYLIATNATNLFKDMYAAPDTVITFTSEEFDNLRCWRRMNASKRRRFDCEAFLKHEVERAIEQAVEPSIAKVHITSYATVGVSRSGTTHFYFY